MRIRAPLPLSLLLAAALLSGPARAEPTDAERAAALVKEGQAALERKDFATAADRFKRASELVPSPAAPPAATPVAAPPPAKPVAVPPPPAEIDDGSGQRAVSYVTFGLGGLGLVLGTVTAVVAANKHAELERLCVQEHCPASAAPKIESYRTVGTASTVGFLAAGMGLGAGAILFFTAPRKKDKAPPDPTLSARAGIGSLQLEGTF